MNAVVDPYAPPRIVCFAAGTPVRTIDGPRPIEEVRIGDRISTQDATSGVMSDQPALAVFHWCTRTDRTPDRGHHQDGGRRGTRHYFETKPVFYKPIRQNNFQRKPLEPTRKDTEPIAVHTRTHRKGKGTGRSGRPTSPIP